MILINAIAEQLRAKGKSVELSNGMLVVDSRPMLVIGKEASVQK